MPIVLPCYLRTHRRKFALTQPDLAMLFGFKSAQHISRLENDKRPPSAIVLLAAEIVFGKRIKEMFPKYFDEMEERLARSLYLMQERLEKDPSAKAAKKRQLITEALHRAVLRANESNRT